MKGQIFHTLWESTHKRIVKVNGKIIKETNTVYINTFNGERDNSSTYYITPVCILQVIEAEETTPS